MVGRGHLKVIIVREGEKDYRERGLETKSELDSDTFVFWHE